MSSQGGSAGARRTGIESTPVQALVLIVSLFFLWGVANNLNDILIKQFKKVFELSDFKAGLVQSAFYGGYFLLAIPASLCMRRFGYKAALLVGLLLYAVGAFLFYPAAAIRTYWLFLGALFIIASGLAFLETAANPLITILGPSEGAARRLNLAQSFNPLGSITGILVGQRFIFSGVELTTAQLSGMSAAEQSAYYASQSEAVRIPYLVIGAVVLLWAALIAAVRLPEAAQTTTQQDETTSIRDLSHNLNFRLAVIAQFFYVGGQVCIWSYLIRYAQQTMPGLPERHAANYLTGALLLFMIGRFVGSILMRSQSPARLLGMFAAAALLLVTVGLLFPGPIGVAALVLSGFFMSIMFPTIFALGLGGLTTETRKTASSFLVMAIIGGATLTVAMGAISDAAGIHHALIVPIACFAVVLGFARYAHKLNMVV